MASALAAATFAARGEAAVWTPKTGKRKEIKAVFGRSTDIDESDPRAVRVGALTANTAAALAEGDALRRVADGTEWIVSRVIADGRLGRAARLTRK